MRALLTVGVLISGVVFWPSGASAQSADLGTACPDTRHASYLHAKNVTCKRAGKVSKYWETKGRGHCPKPWKFRDLGPAPVPSVGGSLLSCHLGDKQVAWTETEGGGD